MLLYWQTRSPSGRNAHGDERTHGGCLHPPPCVNQSPGAFGCTRLASTSAGMLVHFLLCAKLKDPCYCPLCIGSGDLNLGSHAYNKSFIQ